VEVGVGVPVAVDVGVLVAVGVLVGVGVLVAVAVGVGEVVAVEVAVGVRGLCRARSAVAGPEEKRDDRISAAPATYREMVTHFMT
jgi:hypothetical protein